MHNQAEVAILGAVLLDNSVWPQASVVNPHHFSLTASRTIFRRMADLDAAGKPIDELMQKLDRWTPRPR